MGAIEKIKSPCHEQFIASRLERVFAACFADRTRTCLQGGVQEPLYQPASGVDDMHVLYYREDFFASALHEIAHWCIAGEQRRMQPDFGYWYAPDGRTPQQQAAFEAVEYKPQALEWLFSKACGYRFRLSVDNLDGMGGQLPDTTAFSERVLAQARHWRDQGLPQRASVFYRALWREFGTCAELASLQLEADELS